MTEDQAEIEIELLCYKKINLDLHIQIAHLRKALRRVQGADTLKQCHHIAEQMLNGGKHA